MKRLKYVKLFENFESVKYPNSITVELTDVWKDTHELHTIPSEITLSNNDELYYYIGNTELTGFSGILYFASRKDNLIFITGLDMKGMEKKYDLNSLTNLYAKSKMEIDRTGLRKFSAGTCTLGPNADYTGELEVGMSDHRGYFKIVSMK
jgi:hypothetical protein